MGAISSFVEAVSTVVKTAKIVTNIGRPQLVKQLDDLRLNMEQFRQAVRDNDISQMRVLSAECESQSEMLEKRLFSALDKEINASLITKVRRVRRAKTVMTMTISKAAMAKKKKKKEQQTKNRQELREAVEAKKATLASAISTHDDAQRDELLAEIESAIGTLRGLSKSLKNFSV